MSFEMKVKMVKVKGIFEYNMKKSGCLEANLKFEIMINSNYIEREKVKITVMPFHAPFADWPFALMFWHKRALSQSLDLLGKHPFRWLAGKSKHLRCRALAL